MEDLARIFLYRGEGNFDLKDRSQRPAGPREGMGFLGRGQAAPPHHPESWGSTVSFHTGVRGGATAAKWFSRVVSVQSGHSMQFSVVYCSL